MRRWLPLLLALATSAAVGCTPTPAERETTMMPVLDNGSFSADLGGCAIHYEVHGQGPVVMTVLKIAAGLAALGFALIALVAVAGGVVALVRRAVRGPGVPPGGLPQPDQEEGLAKGGRPSARPPTDSG